MKDTSVREYLGILIDYSRDSLIPEKGLSLLTKKGFYKKEWEDSPQESFARAATCYSFGDYDFAQRIYDYASKGWFTFASPVLSNAVEINWPTFANTEFDDASDWLEENVDPDGMPISCFAAGTPVFTKYGLRNIEDIKYGDIVLTHKGRYRKVLGTRKSTSDDIYKLRCSTNTTEIFVTGNHLLLTNTGWKRVDELKKGRDLLAQNFKVDKETTINSLSIFSDYEKKLGGNTTSFEAKTIPNEIALDADLAWAIGFWFAEGSTSDNGQVRVTHGDLEPCDKWQRIVADKFCLNGSSYKAKSIKHNWFNGEVNSVALQRTFDNLFGKGCKVKTLPDSWMESEWPSDIFESFLEGFYLGDGFKTTKTKMFELTNVKLCSQIALLLMEKGYIVSGQYRKYISFNKKKSNNVYNGIVSYRKPEDLIKLSVRDGILMQDGLRYVTIEKLEKQITDPVDVYDIQVEEDESFSVAGIIAHNCFLSLVPDSKEGLVNTRQETAWLSMMGGGVGTYMTNRAPDEKSTGVMSHLKGYDADALSYKQTASRRGSIAVYLDIDHPEIISFLEMRSPVGGDANKKCFNLNNAINITDKFMRAVILGEDYELIDPKHGNTGRFIPAREVWEKILQMRFETGEPYLHFIDTVNRNLPKWITKPTYKVVQSNLCKLICTIKTF